MPKIQSLPARPFNTIWAYFWRFLPPGPGSYTQIHISELSSNVKACSPNKHKISFHFLIFT